MKDMNKQELLVNLKRLRDSYPNDDGHAVIRQGLLIAIGAVEQLGEPEKVEPLVVPKELGEWLCCYDLGDERSLFTIIGNLRDMWTEGDSEEFIGNNKKKLIEVILGTRPYEVEKEKLYYIYDKSTKGYLGYNADKTRLSWYTSKFPNDVFTEQEIKEIDERYWTFAEEVAE